MRGSERCWLTPRLCSSRRTTGPCIRVRARVEHLVRGDEIPPVLIYLAGVNRDVHGSVLMELELAGLRWEPQLKQLGRNALRQRFTDGVVDELLNRQNVTYGDLVAAAGSDVRSTPSVLKSLLKARSADHQLATWLADSALDGEIMRKEAQDELGKLIRTRLGLEVDGADLDRWRSIASRYVLAVEFRADLNADPPRELDGIPPAVPEVRSLSSPVRRFLFGFSERRPPSCRPAC